MKIKLIKALPARQIHLAILAAGSVIDIDDRAAMRLLGRYAEEVKAPKKSREPVEAEKPKEEK